MSRLLSYTEISTALTCFAQWDFAYGGRLAGSTLKPRQLAPILSDGRAWGAGVATWHATGDQRTAQAAIAESLMSDARHEREKGFLVDPERTLDKFDYLCDVLGHYEVTTERLPNLTRLEGELNVPVPSRGGRRGSNRYRFHCYIDGHSTIEHPWIVEFKLRAQLTPTSIIHRQPQYRWYALAYAIEHGIEGPVGVLVDERLNVAPKPPRINKNGKPSHDKRQYCTPEAYRAACAEADVKPSDEALGVFETRRWHQREPLVFTPDELHEAAMELTSAAKLIRDLDSGETYPIRNGKRGNCQSCKFIGVCKDPDNDFLINSVYERTEPKRLRGPKPEGVR